MTSEPDSTRPWLSIKRLVLIILTALVGLVVVQSLLSSWKEPQVASRLQLYQTDLLLEGSAWQGEGLPTDQWPMLREGLLGKDPVATAQKQYEEVRQQAAEGMAERRSLHDEANAPANNSLADEANAGKPLSRRLQNALNQQELLINRLDIRLGLMEAYQGKPEAAIDRWVQVRDSEAATAPAMRTADTLIRLWQDQQTAPGDDVWLQESLDGWFEYRALEKVYEIQAQTDGGPDRIAQLQAQEQATAESKLVKLVLLSTVPALGAVIGIGLLIWLLAQRVLRGSQSVLQHNAGRGWEVPWTAETIWQVLIAGFFFVGQILLPLVLGGLGLGGAALSSRGKAIFSLVYYLLMAAGSLGVLWWSIRAYKPIPKDMFRIKASRSGLLWGLGGYFVALPLMFGVALINQKIWQGQGGSNPLLQTVLEEQDGVALLVFFVTAAIAAPLFEEALFRGFLLPSLTRYLSAGWAIALSAFIFAAAHLSLSEVLPLTVLGAILGFVYTRSRNLLSPMVLHSAWNSATMLGLFILGG
ncbi:CPBP family intramembrane metalloprotease [Nodosilinea sp. LEGE 07298]|uniref:CPBP family intramembrane glutamic endopeptidase n=1 Tax=Nodosilinea sp. LEGE 07298 TaxID=2777970 RepID=UPI00187F2E37|nr:type II CAAX endopeptidase family protein [Nodosilinea sp. LEGE 07298]MBE9110180.1 CPBP family intramembrane metalloprotease [Nodosilinea sp. LEGE 07298]